MVNAREKWNRIYSEDHEAGKIAAVLAEYQNYLPAEGTALDIACGLGENSRFLASLGLSVDAWDISDVAISRLTDSARHAGLDINARVVDITRAALPANTWDVIVICQFLERSIMPAAGGAVRPGGLLCCQTFTREKTVPAGPSNPDFLLETDELKSFVHGWEILAYRDESLNPDPDHPLAGRACIVARKPV